MADYSRAVLNAASLVFEQKIAELQAEIERLRERLEIDPSHSVDGIYARDETIRLQDKHIDELEAENAKLRAALEHYASADNWLGLPGTGVQRVWLEPDSSTRDTYHGYEIARAALGGDND